VPSKYRDTEFHQFASHLYVGQKKGLVTVKALVSGAKGMMGTDLCRELREQGYTVLVTDIQEMDVRRPDFVQQRFAEFHPEVVFHLAALTDVDGCEREPDEAYHTNTIGTQIIALACQAADIPMIYISTLSVFDGTKCEPYTEFDTPNPQSWYSRSKYEGEKIVEQLLRHYYIARAGWMFGGGPEDKKFVAKIIERARTSSELKIVDDKFGSPTYTKDISRAIIRLSQTGWYGRYHTVNTGAPTSRLEFAQKILEYAGITHCRLLPVSSAHFPLPAARPRMEAGRNLHGELLGLTLMRPWAEALQDYVTSTLLASAVETV
jgi:dTDP-4-dehydrorhamnose reductase